MKPLSSSLRSAPVLVACLALSALACKPGKGPSADSGATKDVATVAAAPTGLPAPPDVAAPPADAQKTATGLAYKVLTPGTGQDHPAINDSVKVNYSGWTTDGKMFDSSVAPLQKGRTPQPMTLSLSHVIPGWTEGMQLMTVGEKARFWIPQELAYGGRPGAPAGMLVFDIELLDVVPGPKPPPDVAAPPADAVKLKDGLESKVLTPGTGKAHPEANDAVRVTFSTFDRSGKLIDSSRDKPTVRPVTGFYDGWTPMLEAMVVGEKRIFWVPAALGPKGRPHGPPTPDTTVVVELSEVLPGPKTPPDVKGPPKDAVVEKDGLATKVLQKGTGTAHPTKTQTVTVEYAGWTTDGKLFDASYSRGEPATFPVSGVIPGWTEALQLMVEGEKRRLWIPAELAYKGKPSGPQGMLVFDVQLLKITDGPPPRPQMGPGGPMGRPPGMHGGMRGMGRPPGAPGAPPPGNPP